MRILSAIACVFVGTAFSTSSPIAAQTQLIIFDDGSGLSGEAQFTIVGGGTGLEIRYRNTSTSAPMGFSNSDQIMTSVSWNFAGVATITGGSAAIGATSMTVNFSEGDLGSNADCSGEFGYGNGGSTGLYPNFVGSNMAGNTPFGGPNLDGPTVLDGPQGGLVANPAVVALGGLGAIQDEVVVTVSLSATITDLAFLLNGVNAEYGSDAAFLEGSFPCDVDASNALVADMAGLNLNNGLTPQGGNLPTLGNATYTVCMDDAADTCQIPAGSMTLLFLSTNPAEFTFPGLGCAPGAAGSIMLNPAMPLSIQGPVLWSGPGMPACYTLPIPDDPDLCGFYCSAQGLFLGSGPSGFVLTNRHELIIGS